MFFVGLYFSNKCITEKESVLQDFLTLVFKILVNVRKTHKRSFQGIK